MTVDWTVIGAGYTGLAAARELSRHRPEDRIAICEALHVGEGASGLNSGFAINHAHALGNIGHNNEAEHSETDLYSAGLESLRSLTEEFGIDCDWRETGKFHATTSPQGVELLRSQLDATKQYQPEARLLDANECADHFGTEIYRAALFTPGTVLLNPYSLVSGLADHFPANVDLYENTPVISLDHRDPITVTTGEGEIKTERLILATNAYTPQFRAFRRSLLPFAAFASLTRQLTPLEQEKLGGLSDWGITPLNAYLSPTMQRTGDNRILFRDGIVFRPSLRIGELELEQIGKRHSLRFKQRFPMLSDVTFEFTWGGYLSVSTNGHSGFGQVARNVWVAAGHQGVGITRGTIAGQLIAQSALGKHSPLGQAMAAISSPTRLPVRPVLDLGIKLERAINRWRSRGEC